MTPLPVAFRLSPLIQITLIGLYLALTVPLPFLAIATHASFPPQLLCLGLVIGLMALIAVLSERVILSPDNIQVAYPQWVPKFFRKGWSLSWSEIKALKLRTTGQGGLVYYFTTESAEKAYLLPMRVAGFAKLVKIVEEQTGIDTGDIRPLSQPWMYFILLGFTVLLLLSDSWIIWLALTQR